MHKSRNHLNLLRRLNWRRETATLTKRQQDNLMQIIMNTDKSGVLYGPRRGIKTKLASICETDTRAVNSLLRTGHIQIRQVLDKNGVIVSEVIVPFVHGMAMKAKKESMRKIKKICLDTQMGMEIEKNISSQVGHQQGNSSFRSQHLKQHSLHADHAQCHGSGEQTDTQRNTKILSSDNHQQEINKINEIKISLDKENQSPLFTPSEPHRSTAEKPESLASHSRDPVRFRVNDSLFNKNGKVSYQEKSEFRGQSLLKDSQVNFQTNKIIINNRSGGGSMAQDIFERPTMTPVGPIYRSASDNLTVSKPSTHRSQGNDGIIIENNALQKSKNFHNKHYQFSDYNQGVTLWRLVFKKSGLNDPVIVKSDHLKLENARCEYGDRNFIIAARAFVLNKFARDKKLPAALFVARFELYLSEGVAIMEQKKKAEEARKRSARWKDNFEERTERENRKYWIEHGAMSPDGKWLKDPNEIKKDTLDLLRKSFGVGFADKIAGL